LAPTTGLCRLIKVTGLTPNSLVFAASIISLRGAIDRPRNWCFTVFEAVVDVGSFPFCVVTMMSVFRRQFTEYVEDLSVLTIKTFY